MSARIALPIATLMPAMSALSSFFKSSFSMSALLGDGCVGTPIVAKQGAGTPYSKEARVMTSAQFPITEDAEQVYKLLLSLRVASNHQRLYLLAQEVGLLRLIEEHVPSVLAQRFPENQLIARVEAMRNTAGGKA